MNILDVSPYAVYPPNSGGRLRIHYLNLNAAYSGHEVSLFSQDVLSKDEIRGANFIKRISIAEKYTEYRYVNLASLTTNYITVSLGLSKIFSGDLLKVFRPKILTKLVENSDVIKVENPWQFEYVYNIAKKEGKPIVLVEIDANFKRLEQTMKYSKFSSKLYYLALKKEQYALENADKVFVVSEVDKKAIISKFGIEKNKIYVVPNGVDITRFSSLSLDEKNKYKNQIIGDSSKKVILFVGSLYPPNVEAVKNIIYNIAPKVTSNYKDIIFVIVGSVGKYFKGIGRVSSILITGPVEDVMPYFKIADIAINPISSGSGTNIKLLEYLASGIPTVTTPFGARGIDLKNKKNAIVTDLPRFPEAILELLDDEKLKSVLSKYGRKLVEKEYDWKEISKKELGILNHLKSNA